VPDLLQNRVALRRRVTAGDRELIAGALGRVSGNGPAAEQIRVDLGDGDAPGGAGVLSVRSGDVARVGIDGSLPRDRELALMFVAVVGSRAQGLEEERSDVDRRGFYVPAARLHFSLDGAPAQLVHDGDQLCFWEVEKFIRLGLGANPTVLETLHSPTIEFVSPVVAGGLSRLTQQGAFLSRRAGRTFMGYAESQFDKMQRARDRGSPITWRHAMHLIRLLHVGIGLVGHGTLDVRVPAGRRATLLAIKQGEIEWEEIVRMRRQLTADFEDALAGTPLPEEPDVSAVESFLIDLRLAVAAAEESR
jgi:hypothetical protein